jgi:protein-S-isoprenylcysteine O-methyltransferase Ste14
MILEIRRVIEFAWYALIGVWLVGALTAKPQVRTQPLRPRIIHAALLLIAFELLFTHMFRFGLLGQRFILPSAAVAEFGMILTLAGIAFAIWARFFLGTNWSATPSIKQDHRLIRTGPYAIVRHPIYSGLLLAMFGTALAIGEWRAVLGFAIVSVAWHFKSRTEERYMEEEFGDEYVRYRREVKGLIPFVL